MKKNIIKSIFHTTGTNLICLLASFLGGVLLSRTLGVEGKGLLAIYLNLYNLVLILSSLGVRQYSSFLHSRKGHSIYEIIKNQNAVYILSYLISNVCIVFYFFINVDLDYQSIVIISLMIAFSLFVNFRTFIALSNKEIGVINRVKLIQTICPYFIYFLISLKYGYSVDFYLIGNLISYTLAAIYICFRYKIYNHYQIKFKHDQVFCLIKGGIKYSLPLFLFNLNYKVDQFIIAAMLNNSSVGVYSIAATLSELIWQVPNVLSLVIISYGLNSKNDKKFSKAIFNNSLKLMLVLLPVCVAYNLVVVRLITPIYGEGFSQAASLMPYLLPGAYAIILFNLLNADAASKGYPHLSVIPFILCLITNVIGNYIFIPKYGLTGAALMSTFSYVIASVVYVYIYIKKIL